MNLWQSCDAALCMRLTLTLAHFLWQGLAVAALCAAANFALRRRSPQARYLVYFGGLVLMALCLPATFVIVSGQNVAHSAANGPAAAVERPGVERPASPAIEPDFAAAPSGSGPYARRTDNLSQVPVERVSTAAELASSEAAPREEGALPRWAVLSPYASSLYLAGVAAMLARLLMALRGAERLRREAAPLADQRLLAMLRAQAGRLGLRALPPLAVCCRVATPVVVGVLRPMILLPLCMATGLAAEQLQAALLHELAHIRRYDPLANLLQRLVEAFLFFHPAVWYVSRRASAEREHCCDELAVAAGMGRLEYAASLVRIAELCSGALPPPAAAVLAAIEGRPAPLRRRIVRLLDGTREPEVRLTRRGILALGAALVLLSLTPIVVQCWAGSADHAAKSEEQTPATGETVAAAPSKQTPAGDGSYLNDPDLKQALRYDAEYNGGDHDVGDQKMAEKHYLAFIGRSSDSAAKALAWVQIGVLYSTNYNVEKDEKPDHEKSRRCFAEALKLEPRRIGDATMKARLKIKGGPDISREERMRGRVESLKWLRTIDEAALRRDWLPYGRGWGARREQPSDDDIRTFLNTVAHVKSAEEYNLVGDARSMADPAASLHWVIAQLPGTQAAESARKALSQLGAAAKSDKTSVAGAFRTTTPSGVTVELLGLSYYPDKGQPWWRADGSPLPAPPYDPSDMDIRSSNDPKSKSIELALRLGGATQGLGREAAVRRDRKEGVLWAGRRFQGAKPLDDVKSIATRFLVEQDTGDLRLSIAAGAWRTIASADRAAPGGGDDAAKVTFSARQQDPQTVLITVRHAAYDVEQEQRQVMLIDMDGKRHNTIWRANDHTVGDRMETEWSFRDVSAEPIPPFPVERIRSFELQSRPYEDIAFRNLALRPGTKTNPEIAASAGADLDSATELGKRSPTRLESAKAAAEQFLRAAWKNDLETIDNKMLLHVAGTVAGQEQAAIDWWHRDIAEWRKVYADNRDRFTTVTEVVGLPDGSDAPSVAGVRIDGPGGPRGPYRWLLLEHVPRGWLVSGRAESAANVPLKENLRQTLEAMHKPPAGPLEAPPSITGRASDAETGKAATGQRDAESNALIGMSVEDVMKKLGPFQSHWNIGSPTGWAGHSNEKTRPGKTLLVLTHQRGGSKVQDAFWTDQGRAGLAFRNPPPLTAERPLPAAAMKLEALRNENVGEKVQVGTACRLAPRIYATSPTSFWRVEDGYVIFAGYLKELHADRLVLVFSEDLLQKPLEVIPAERQATVARDAVRFIVSADASPAADASPKAEARPSPDSRTKPPAGAAAPAEQPGADVEGAQLQLQLDKAVWPAGTIPALRAALRYAGTRPHLCVVEGQRNLQLEVDGKWYRWPVGLRGGPELPLPAGASTETPTTLSPLWHEAKDEELQWGFGRNGGVMLADDRPCLQLTPGKHRVRVACLIEPAFVDAGNGFRVVSNAVEVTIDAVARPPHARWPASPEVTKTVIKLHREHTSMMQLFIPGKDSAQLPKLLKEVLDGAAELAKQAADTPLEAEAQALVKALTALDDAVRAGTPPSDEMRMASGRAAGRLISVLSGEPQGKEVPGTVVLQAAAQPAENSNVRWGKEVKGLQIGLACEFPDQTCHVGQTVRFKLYVRNRGDKAVELVDYDCASPPRDDAFLFGWAPTVQDADGKNVFVGQQATSFQIMARKRQLASGKTMLVGTISMHIGATPRDQLDSMSDPEADLKPGAYQVNQTYRFDQHDGATWSGELTTGKVELKVAAAEAPARPVGQKATAAGAANAATAEALDTAEVRRKIAALAAPDETVPADQQAVNWLSMRREKIAPQLIAGLDDKHPKVAEGCLEILWSVPASKELTDALVAKAGDEKSPLRYAALRQLEKSAADPRAARLLDQASTQPESFARLTVRARWALLAGNKDRAVDILKPLQKIEDSSEHVEAIRLLGEIGTPAAVELLEPIAAGERWEWAAEAYRALAKGDPVKHGLTKDQAAVLQGWRGFKETSDTFHRRMQELAKLNVNEVRPLVMQMLRDTGYGGQSAALEILSAWKDKEALPEVRAVMQNKRSPIRGQAVAAYLAIDDRRQARDDVLELLVEKDEFGNERVLAGIVTAEIPADHKVSMLRAARAKLESPRAVPSALRYQRNQDHDVRELLVPLMDEESNLLALGGYCELAAADKEKRFAPQVRRAMERLAREPTVSAGDENLSGDAAWAGQVILAAAATYDLKEFAPQVRKLMSSKNATIRAAAQAAGAKLIIPGAMKDLCAQLGDKDTNVRALAAKSLLNITPADETERAACEQSVLSCLGKPAEDYSLRVLATCGGEKAVKALESILDDRDARRAVYAAWVLAQLPDKAAAAKAVRRVAIFGLFHHQVYQQGDGIDFYIAPDLYFHQVTGRLNPDPEAYAAGEGPVRIPNDPLRPFAWDDAEQQYAVRCYQLAETGADGYAGGLDVDFLRRGPAGQQNRMGMDSTQLPLLKEIAATDWHLEPLMVKGQTVAHFPYRQTAAKAIAAISKEKATYRGLAGETLLSDAFPEPYPDQDKLLARFFVDRVRKAQLPDKPQKDRHWQRFAVLQAMARHLQERIAPQVYEAIRQEAEQQQINLQNILPKNR